MCAVLRNNCFFVQVMRIGQEASDVVDKVEEVNRPQQCMCALCSAKAHHESPPHNRLKTKLPAVIDVACCSPDVLVAALGLHLPHSRSPPCKPHPPSAHTSFPCAHHAHQQPSHMSTLDKLAAACYPVCTHACSPRIKPLHQVLLLHSTCLLLSAAFNLYLHLTLHAGAPPKQTPPTIRTHSLCPSPSRSSTAQPRVNSRQACGSMGRCQVPRGAERQRME
jgi:hypothetical protein